jgi:membrane-associated PAP2 superfamily phosphatase
MAEQAARHDDALWQALLSRLGWIGLTCLVIFLAAPDIDIWVASLFHAAGAFPFWTDSIARLREIYRGTFIALCLIALLGLAGVLHRQNGPVHLQLWAFATLVPLIGPGLIVNAVLKNHWGRARPLHIEAFGGDRSFSLPFEIADQCTINCSFASGEGASAAAMLVVLAGLFGHLFAGRAGRLLLWLSGAVWLTGAALVRMVPGKHFLSELLFAFQIVALVGLLLYRLLGVGQWRRAVAPLDYLDGSLLLPRRWLARRQGRA